MTDPENPPAFPLHIPTDTPWHYEMGMSLRDYFAAHASTDDIQRVIDRHLSLNAQETLTGLIYPPEPEPKNRFSAITREQVDAFTIARAEFHLALYAALRIKFADALLAARKEAQS